MANTPPQTYTDKFLLKDVLDESGNLMPTRQFLQIVGSGVLRVTDDPVNNVTVIELQSGSSAGQGTTAVVNGLNPNVATLDNPTLRLSGPSGPFSVGGFTVPGAVAPEPGQTLDVVNTTAQPMTVVHEDTTSTAMYRIAVASGVSVPLPPYATARLVYDGTASRWKLQNTGAAYPRDVDVRDYGAKVDGATDDTAAALAALASGAQTVRVPPGTMNVSGPLVASVAGVTLKGAGMTATTIVQTTPGAEVFSSTDTTNVTIEDLAVQSAGGAHAVHFTAASNSDVMHPTVARVWVKPGFGSPGKAVTGISGNALQCAAHGFANGTVVQVSAGFAGFYSTDLTFAASGNTITLPGHGLLAGDPVQISDAAGVGSYPAPLVAFTKYFVVNPTTNAFQLSATYGGSAIAFTGTGAPLSGIYLWPLVPGGLEPYLEYFVVGATTNSFGLAATVGGSAIAITGAPASTCRVAQVFAGIFFESAGNNIYSPRVRGCLVDGGQASYTDGSARHGIRAMQTSGGDEIVHLTIVGGETANVKTGVAAAIGAEVYATAHHVYNCVEGSGGGTAFYCNANVALTSEQTRVEGSITAYERVIVFGPGSNSCRFELGDPSFDTAPLVNLGTSNSWRIGVDGNVLNNESGLWTFDEFVQDRINEKVATQGVSLNGAATFYTGGTVFTQNVLRQDLAGAAFTFGSGENVNFGDLLEYDAQGNACGAWQQSFPRVFTVGAVGAGVSSSPNPAAATADCAMLAEVTVVARRTGGSRGTGAVDDSACFVRNVLVKNVAGTVAIVGSAQTVGTDILDSDLTSASLPAPTFAITSNELVTNVGGVANVNLTWCVSIRWKSQNY